ncbi:MAG: sigma-54 dependent transcriptional regulator [Planctomycetes bacterium]|nr:sigma-54 dependent transcriptional regulator [Planctomycetota bacterium]NUQ34648.1 sigma-54-dependent Fis family transcriptional regulator [Planctomycetaceae bacterium]
MPDEHPTILVIDDDEAHADVTAEVLDRANKGYECVIVHHGEAAQRLLMQQKFDVVLCDLKLPDIDGIRLLEIIKERSADTEVIIMTGYGSVERAVEALQKGAFSFLEKPLHKDSLRNQVAKALERKQMVAANRELKKLVDERFGFEGLIGNSPAMKAVFDRIRQVAPTDARVLITGPNGSGKDLVARAIHHNSKRSDAPFVAFNCGAITGDLLQSELFGHVRGAFTGADKERKGKFEFASGGTLFLDEIGEMPTEAQVKLLRMLETREVTRLGANESVKVDVRLISATNKNLEEEVRAGRFREDLFFRLKVVQIDMPPLKARGSDILLLAETFLRELAKQYDKPVRAMAQEVQNALLAHDWPGNVRELRNVMEEMVVLAAGEILTVDSLPANLKGKAGKVAPIIASADIPAGENIYKALVGTTMSQIEEQMIRATLKAYKGNREKTADTLGIGERTLYRKLKEYGLS